MFEDVYDGLPTGGPVAEATTRDEILEPAPKSIRAVDRPRVPLAARQERFLEAIPSIFSWLAVTAPLWLTMLDSRAGLLFVSLAVAFFIVRTFRYGVLALVNRRRVLKALAVDWWSRLRSLPGWDQVKIVFLIRAYREGNLAMLRQTLLALERSNWPRLDGQMLNVMVVFATEEHDTVTRPLVAGLADEFRGRLVVRDIAHPYEPHVLPGPSSAMHYVGGVLYGEAVARGADPSRVLLVDLDADTVLEPGYLPCLVYSFLTDPHRDRRVYQPVVLFTRDYWQAPLHSRLSALGNSALTLGWNGRPSIAFTGAAGSLALYHSVDFWPTQSHSQDSGVELRLWMRYGRAFAVVGLPIVAHVYPVMAIGERRGPRERMRTYGRSFVSLFRQSARWREGPLDEFVEAARGRQVPYTLWKLYAGVERDTLSILPGLGPIALRMVADPLYLSAVLPNLQTIGWIGLTAVTLLGLAVSWTMLTTRAFVPATPRRWRPPLELLLFWLAWPFYIPLLSGLAGLKTSSAYLVGKRPNGHYIPTPK